MKSDSPIGEMGKMGMTITKFENTIIPQTLDGRKFANEYEKRLREQGVFSGRTEDTQSIVIKVQYYLMFEEGDIINEN